HRVPKASQRRVDAAGDPVRIRVLPGITGERYRVLSGQRTAVACGPRGSSLATQQAAQTVEKPASRPAADAGDAALLPDLSRRVREIAGALPVLDLRAGVERFREVIAHAATHVVDCQRLTGGSR